MSSRELPLIVCCSAGYMVDRMRLDKLRDLLVGGGIAFEYWGWSRGAEFERAADYPIRHLVRGGGYANKRLAFFYPLWILAVFWRALRLGKRRAVWAVGLDTALPICLASRLRRFRFVFDNPDNVTLTYGLEGWRARLVNALERFVAKRASSHVLPDRSRFEARFGNERFLPNTPLKSAIDAALECHDFDELDADERTRVYANGFLTPARGSAFLAELIQAADPASHRFLIAGDVLCDELEPLLARENVSFYGRVSGLEALALYRFADIVPAFYDPALPINRVASPNKWWDCVAMRVPFLTNDGILTVEPFVESGHAMIVPFEDVTAGLEALSRAKAVRAGLRAGSEDEANGADVPDWKRGARACVDDLLEAV